MGERRAFGRWLRAIWPPLPVWRRLDLAVGAVAAYTALVVFGERFVGGHLPDWTSGSALINALVLGVLLGFRNREAYDRWWEARKLWGQLINDSRSLCTKLAARTGVSAETRDEVRRLVPAFAVALKDRLCGATGPVHVPLDIYGRLVARLQAERDAGRLTEMDLLVLDPHVRGLMDVCGGCERIKSTPIPLSYRSLLRHGMVLYLLSTPWLVADALGWWSVLTVTLFAYFLLGVELTAEDVEDPFGSDGDDLSLAAYCETVRAGAEQVFLPPPRFGEEAQDQSPAYGRPSE